MSDRNGEPGKPGEPGPPGVPGHKQNLPYRRTTLTSHKNILLVESLADINTVRESLGEENFSHRDFYSIYY